MRPVTLSLFLSPWDELGRIHRRICILRMRGRDEEARRVREREFDPAVEALRALESDRPGFDERLAAALAKDLERVADAFALSEILLPVLTEELAGTARAARDRQCQEMLD